MTRFSRRRLIFWFGCLSVSIPVVLAGNIYYYVSIVKLTYVLSNIEYESL
jgi:hypothetical protein